ncbi:MAG: UDP-N-acetylmuramoyl-L-alanine--D-glutamate ligase [Opitutaceae bacterium]|nr:UDP-N-acetylmuramoyl-L-alanine--D-glutamate ligase [Opitutaceae bacterium]
MPLAIPEFLQVRLRQPVAIFGGGVSGEGVLALLGKVGVAGIIYDQRGRPFTPADAAGHALAVVSPGFAPTHPWVTAAEAAGVPWLGELDFASCFWQGQVVAITGTNGKTTLTEFLAHALTAAGESAAVAGNIGRPFSRVALDADGGAGSIAVCEVSSFQAETLRHLRADVTLWTNFAEDHLERHGDMAAYFRAKWNLVARTTPGSVFAGTSVQRMAAKLGLALPAGAAVASEDAPADARLAGTVFATYPQRENLELAAAWWRASGRDMAALHAAARTFRLGRHRLARVGEHDGVAFWNDSKATNFHAVEAALAGFDRPVLVILGGKPKGGDLAAFVKRLAPRVKHASLIGETREELSTYCRAYGVPHTVCESLADAVRNAAARAVAGEAVLLSPGFASFDQFRNYEDRGEQFETLVRGLASTPSLR